MSAHRRTRSRWHPPPPPTPKILHLPRRIRLHRPPVPARPAPALSHPRRNLLSLFIKEQNTNTIDRTFESKEKRTAEAAPLRAECNFLRIERDAALQKLEKTRERKKIDGSDIIAKKMGKLKVRSKEAVNVMELREIEPPLWSSSLVKHEKEIDVEIVKRKMEGLSKGVLERIIHEYGSFFFNNNNGDNSVGSSGKNRMGRIGCRQEVADLGSKNQAKETGALARARGCCNCKQIVARIAKEVKAESEQWTEMQEMVDQVRVEMEDLRSSRDLWQRRALASEHSLHYLYSQILEWKRKARASEQEVTELQRKALQLEKPSGAVSPSQDGFSKDRKPDRLAKIKCQQAQQILPDCSTVETEKHVLICRLNGAKSKFPTRSPLQEIKNYSDL